MKLLNNIVLNVRSITAVAIIIVLFIFLIFLISILTLNEVFISKISDSYFLKVKDQDLYKTLVTGKSLKNLNNIPEINTDFNFFYNNDLLYQDTKLNNYRSYILELRGNNRRNFLFITSFCFIFTIFSLILFVFIINQNISKLNLRINNIQKRIAFRRFLNENINRRFKNKDSIFLINILNRLDGAIKNLNNKRIELSKSVEKDLTDFIGDKSCTYNFTFIINRMLSSITFALNQDDISVNNVFHEASRLNRVIPLSLLKENLNAGILPKGKLNHVTDKRYERLNKRPQFNMTNTKKSLISKKEVEDLTLKLKVIFSVFKGVNNKGALFCNDISSDLNGRIKKITAKFKAQMKKQKDYKEKIYNTR